MLSGTFVTCVGCGGGGEVEEGGSPLCRMCAGTARLGLVSVSRLGGWVREQRASAIVLVEEESMRALIGSVCTWTRARLFCKPPPAKGGGWHESARLCPLPPRCPPSSLVCGVGCVCPYVQDAVRGEFREVAKLLIDHGGKVYEDRQVRPASCGEDELLWGLVLLLLCVG